MVRLDGYRFGLNEAALYPAFFLFRLNMWLKNRPRRGLPAINPGGGTSVRGSCPCSQLANTRTIPSRVDHVLLLALPKACFQRRNRATVI